MFIVARKPVTRVCVCVWVKTTHLHSSRDDLDTNYLNNLHRIYTGRRVENNVLS